MLKEYALKKLLDEALRQCGKFLKNENCRLITNSDDFFAAIKDHCTKTENWCNDISLIDSKLPKHTASSYVDLELLTMPRFTSSRPSECIDKVPLTSLIANNSVTNSVILGQPGSGKTSSLKFICHKMLTDENFAPQHKLLIAIRLRDLNPRTLSKKPKRSQDHPNNILFQYLAGVLGISFSVPTVPSNSITTYDRTAILEGAVQTLLNNLNALLLLDGFDEIAYYEHRECVLSEFRSLTLGLRDSSVILTSRTGEFQYFVDNAKIFEICPLDLCQVQEFTEKWLGSTEEVNNFVEQLKGSPFFDTTLRPLNLAQLCAIFERTGEIPEKPKTVYRKVVDLLIREWDEQRSVKRYSQYSGFEPDRKFDFLTSLSYALSLTQKQTVFSSSIIERIYKKICRNFGLNIDQSKLVAKEIESHTGLIIQNSHDTFEFCHKSIQEYLAAEHIVRLPFIPEENNTLISIPNELAISVSISSDSSQYLSALILNRFLPMNLPKDFISTFVTRLIQEKPDFNSSDDVIVALLVLYSMYILETSLSGPIQYRLFYDDSSAREFDLLLEKISISNSFEVLDKNYKITRNLYKTDGIDMIELTKLSSSKISRYPQVILIKSGLLPNADVPPDKRLKEV